MTKFIGVTFPDSWLWSKYEKFCIQSLLHQVESKYPTEQNLVINLTWFGPQFSDFSSWNEYQQLVNNAVKFDNLFLLSTVDPAMINADQIAEINKSLGNPRLFKVGNFDGKYHFNFFAPVLAKHFKKYTEEEILLDNPQWLYINYNRKPREHRVALIKKLQEKNLDNIGLNTLGCPNLTYDRDATNTLYLTLGERPEDYVQFGHWYQGPSNDEFGIPHDVLSLHNIKYWRNHFLHIVGATEFNVWDDIFVSETQFKPIIGMRPFLINGNIRTYEWLRTNGFKTFNHWFPGINFEDENTVHDSICHAIEQLQQLSADQIKDMYHAMLPDLRYNRKRFFSYAQEQKNLVDCLL